MVVITFGDRRCSTLQATDASRQRRSVTQTETGLSFASGKSGPIAGEDCFAQEVAAKEFHHTSRVRLGSNVSRREKGGGRNGGSDNNTGSWSS